MKIIFLDIDGVMNHTGTDIRKHHFVSSDGVALFDVIGINPENVEVLNQIVDVSKAKVVLSSTWRIAPGLAQTVHSLKRAGFKHEIFDVTPDGLMDPEAWPNRKFSQHRPPRGHEIRVWIERWDKSHPEDPVSHFVILDDNETDVFEMDKKLVLTEFYVHKTKGGLREDHFEAIYHHLGVDA